jgi:hypothetical protein
VTNARVATALTSLTLALVLVVGGLLPPEHVHAAGVEGRSRSIVHRHAVAGDVQAPSQAAVTPHGDHDRALFLEAVYDRAARVAPDLPAVVSAAVIVAPPVHPVAPVRASDVRRTHGPPGTSRPTRAPPSLS